MLASTSSEREADVVHTLVRLADVVVHGDDELEVLRDLADSSVRILDADAAGIALGVGDRLGFVVGTSEATEAIELYQCEQQQGPCLDSYRSGRPVHCDDVREAHARWPQWTSRALELGVRSADSFPMRLRDEIIGALTLYANHPRTLGDRDRAVVCGLADMATIGILHDRDERQHDIVRTQLERALDSRVIIEQAKGVLSSRHDITPDAAFDRLRSHARSNRTRIAVVARDVVEANADV